MKVTNITKSFSGNTVLKNISFEVEPGKIYGLVGKNGAGKTTLLNIIAGLTVPDSGDLTVEKMKGKNSTIGFLPDVPAFYDYLTAEEYLDFILQKRDELSIENRNRLLDLVKINGTTRIKTMSRGMKQRLGIAAILIGDPDVILLDEPTSALDPAGRYELMEILLTLKAQNKVIILSTHILNDMEKICDYIGFLHNGLIVREVDPSQNYSAFLEVEVIFESSVKVIEIPNHKVEKIDECRYEIRTDGSIINPVEQQKRLLSALSDLNVQISGIRSLRPSLDIIFQEVCS